MCRPKRISLPDLDKDSPDRKAFFETALKEMEELADEAGDWRVHVPYEALVSYRKDSAVREQFVDHYNNCPFCQEGVETFNPYD